MYFSSFIITATFTFLPSRASARAVKSPAQRSADDFLFVTCVSMAVGKGVSSPSQFSAAKRIRRLHQRGPADFLVTFVDWRIHIGPEPRHRTERPLGGNVFSEDNASAMRRRIAMIRWPCVHVISKRESTDLFWEKRGSTGQKRASRRVRR